MGNATYKKAMKLFEVPEEFYEVTKLMLTEEEIELIVLMGKEKYQENELEKIISQNKISKNSKELIDNCYSRAVLQKEIEEDKTFYSITNLYERFPYFAQYEVEGWSTVSKEMKKQLNDWDLKEYVAIFGDDVRKNMDGEHTYVHNSQFLTLQETDEYIDKNQDLIYIIPCNCKAMMFYHDKPVDVCMNFKGGLNSHLDRGYGERISKERAKELIREYNRKGLMQNGEDYAICNCDGVCCYPLQMARELGSKHVYPKSNYNIKWNEDECINCGKCTTICNFGAFYFDENKKVQYDSEKCWECTICVPNCPVEAIEMTKKHLD